MVVFDLDTSKRIAEFETEIKRVKCLFCSDVDNDFVYVVDDNNRKMITQFNILTGKSINKIKVNFRKIGPLESISPDGKWLGYFRRAVAFDESNAQMGRIHLFSKDGKAFVSPPQFQHWGVREEGRKDGNVPTPLLSRKDSQGHVSYALHPSVNLLAEGRSYKSSEGGKIKFRYGLRFSHAQYENTIANLVFDLPTPQNQLKREYDSSAYNSAVQNERTLMSVFDEQEKLAITTIGPNAFVVHLTDSILKVNSDPPKKPMIVDSEGGVIFAKVGEKISFDVSLTENANVPITLSKTPEGLSFKNRTATWQPSLSDIGAYRLDFEARIKKSPRKGHYEILNHATVITVLPHYLDLKGRVERSAISTDGSKLAYLTATGRSPTQEDNHVVVVDTQKRKVLQKFKVDEKCAMAVNKDHVFALSRSSLRRFEIKTGNEKILNTENLGKVYSMYLDQLNRLVLTGEIRNRLVELSKTIVLDSKSLQPIVGDVRAGSVRMGSFNNPHLRLGKALGPINDTPEQPPNRKLVRHCDGGIVDLQQNKFITVPPWVSTGFTLPYDKQKGQQNNLLAPSPFFPRWDSFMRPIDQHYSLPFEFQSRSSSLTRASSKPRFGDRNTEGADLLFTSLVGNQSAVVPAWRVKDKLGKIGPLSKEKPTIDQLKLFPKRFNEVTEIHGRNVYLAARESSKVLFNEIPEGFIKELKYPLTLVPPKVMQFKLGANSTMVFNAIGEQNKAEFSLDRAYEYLTINKDTGVLTIDGLGIQNAWLDQQFPLRQADEKIPLRDLQRSLKNLTRLLPQNKLDHTQHIGVPVVPRGFYPVCFSFTVNVKNTGDVEKRPERDRFKNHRSPFDANSHRMRVKVIGLIKDQFIKSEINNAQLELNKALRELEKPRPRLKPKQTPAPI